MQAKANSIVTGQTPVLASGLAPGLAFGRTNPFGMVLLACFLTSLPVACASHQPTETPDGTGDTSGLHIGVLFDHSGLLGDYGKTGDDGVSLALAQINQAGGVLGLPVTATYVDAATELESSVAGARHLSRKVGVHAIIGPLGSAATLAVANQVTIPDGIPTISPTATSPEITVLADNGFVFRGTPSDAAQAPVLAMLAVREGARHLAVFFQDDAYGRGLASALDEHFAGPITHQPVDSVHASTFEAELIAAAAAGADTLIAMSYVPTAAIYLREAASLGLFERVLLVDATASPDLAKALGADAVEGFKGTAPAGVVAGLEGAESRNAGQDMPGHEDTNTGARSFATTFEAATGRRPTSGLEALAYDLVICVALATEHAGRLDRDAIRRALPAVCGQGGRQIHPDAESIAMGLASARNHEAIDYDGASGALEWNARGDIATGSISIWQFKAGRITVLESIPFDLR